MRPWYASEPRQLDGARVASVADPVAVSRAWALFVLLDAPDRSPPDPPAAPAWVRKYVPWLGRLWGDGLLAEFDRRAAPVKVHRLAVNQAVLDWSRIRPRGPPGRRPAPRREATHRRARRRRDDCSP